MIVIIFDIAGPATVEEIQEKCFVDPSQFSL